MFWKKKKEEPVVLVKDNDKWVKEVLLDFNLLDTNNLWGLMEIASEKNQKILLRSILDKMQPLLIEEIKKGNNRAILTLKEEQLPSTVFEGFSWPVFEKIYESLLKNNYSLDIINLSSYNYTTNSINNNSLKPQYQITLTLLKSKSKEK